MWVNLLDLIYPVGSFYFQTKDDEDNTPTALFGGTWVEKEKYQYSEDYPNNYQDGNMKIWERLG